MTEFGTWTSDIELAHRLADEAARIALGYFGRDVDHVAKKDGTPVSAADRAVEAALLEAIARERPDDAVLSEERGGAARSERRRWILDPIDGTEPFLAHALWWGTHIALEQEGEVVVAVLTRPAARQRWWAVRGHGTYVGGDDDPLGHHRRVSVSDTDRLADASMSGFFQAGSPTAAKLAEGSGWVEIDDDLAIIPAVAEGRLDAVIDPGAGFEWDHAAQQLVVTEAGGRFYDAHGGQRIDTGVGIYTNGRIDEELLSRLATLGIGPSPTTAR